MKGAEKAPAAKPEVPEQPAVRPDEHQLERLRVDIAGTIKQVFPWLLWLTAAVAVTVVAMGALGYFSGRTMDATVLSTSVQVAFGMVIGFVCVYLGLMMTWFGLDASYTLRGSIGTAGAKAEGSLKSASPGLLFALAGIALIAVSLHKTIYYQESGLHSASQSVGPGDPTAPTFPTIRKTQDGRDR